MKHYPKVNIGELMVGPSNPVRVMSAINLSPESFYKASIADGIDKFHEMLENASKDGADIIDIGGASTAPKDIYSTSDVSVDEEIERVTRALDALNTSKYPPLSIDTTSSRVAEVALNRGVSMVNDTSGLHMDTKMASLVADWCVPIVLMANCNGPCDSILASLNSLKDSLSIAKTAGIKTDKIIIDPGIGFGKPADVDAAILRELNIFAELNHPLLVGVSRKSFIGHFLDTPNPDDRLTGSIIATAVAVMNGANIIRTHDIRETKIAIKMGVALRKPNMHK